MRKNILPLLLIASGATTPLFRKEGSHTVSHVISSSIKNQLLPIPKLITAGTKRGDENPVLAGIGK